MRGERGVYQDGEDHAGKLDDTEENEHKLDRSEEGDMEDASMGRRRQGDNRCSRRRGLAKGLEEKS